MLPRRHGRSESPARSGNISSTIRSSKHKPDISPSKGSTRLEAEKHLDNQPRPSLHEQHVQLQTSEGCGTSQQQTTSSPAKRRHAFTGIDERSQKQQCASAHGSLATGLPQRQHAAASRQSDSNYHSTVDRSQQHPESLAKAASAAVLLPEVLAALNATAFDNPARCALFLPQLLHLATKANAQEALAAALAIADLSSTDAAAFRQSFIKRPQQATLLFQAISTCKSSDACTLLSHVAGQWETTVHEDDELLTVLCRPHQLQHLLQATQHPLPAVKDIARCLAESMFEAAGADGGRRKGVLEDSMHKLLTNIGSYHDDQQAAVGAAEALAALSGTTAGIKVFSAAAPNMDILWRVIQDGPAAVAAAALAFAVNMAGSPGPAYNLIVPGAERLLRRAAVAQCPVQVTDGVLKVLFVLAQNGASGLRAIGHYRPERTFCGLLELYHADLCHRSAAAAGVCAVLVTLLLAAEDSGKAAAQSIEDKLRTAIVSASIVGQVLKLALAAPHVAPSWLPLSLTAGNTSCTAAEAAMRLLEVMADRQPALLRTALAASNQNALGLVKALESSSSAVREGALSALRRLAACHTGKQTQRRAFWQALSQEGCTQLLLQMMAGRSGDAVRSAAQEVLCCCLRQEYAAVDRMLSVLVNDGMYCSFPNGWAEAIAATIAGSRFLYNKANSQHLLPHAIKLSKLVQDISCVDDANRGLRAACALMYLAGMARWFPEHLGVQKAAHHVLQYLRQFSRGSPAAVPGPQLSMTATAACIFLSAVLQNQQGISKAINGSSVFLPTTAGLLLKQLLSDSGIAALMHLTQQLADLPQQEDQQQPQEHSSFQQAFSTLLAALPKPRPSNAAAAALETLKQVMDVAPLDMCTMLLGRHDKSLLDLFLRTLGRPSHYSILDHGVSFVTGLQAHVAAFGKHDLVEQLLQQVMLAAEAMQLRSPWQGGQHLISRDEDNEATAVGGLICLACVAAHSKAGQRAAIVAAAAEQLMMWLQEDFGWQCPLATAAACAALRALLHPLEEHNSSGPEAASSSAGHTTQSLVAALLTAERLAALLNLMQQDERHANLDALTTLLTGNSPDRPSSALAAAGLALFSKLTEAESPLLVAFVESRHCWHLLLQCGGSLCDVVSSMAIRLVLKLDALAAAAGSPLHPLWLRQMQQLQHHIVLAVLQEDSIRLAKVMIALCEHDVSFVVNLCRWLDPLLRYMDPCNYPCTGSNPCAEYVAMAVFSVATLPAGKQLFGARPDRVAVLVRAFAGGCQEVASTEWKQLHVDVSHHSSLALWQAAEDLAVQEVLTDPILLSLLLNQHISNRARYTEESVIAVMDTVRLVAGAHWQGAQAALSHVDCLMRLNAHFKAIYPGPATHATRTSAAATVVVLFNYPDCLPVLLSDRFVADCICVLVARAEHDVAAAKAIATAAAAAPEARKCIERQGPYLLDAMFEWLKQASVRFPNLDDAGGVRYLLEAVSTVIQDRLEGNGWADCWFVHGVLGRLVERPSSNCTRAIIVSKVIRPLMSCRKGLLLLFKHRRLLEAAAHEAQVGAGVLPKSAAAAQLAKNLVVVITDIMEHSQTAYDELKGELRDAELEITMAVLRLAAVHNRHRQVTLEAWRQGDGRMMDLELLLQLDVLGKAMENKAVLDQDLLACNNPQNFQV